ncbi:tubulin-specific chaperone A-like [Bolinopsis microptera]|uniref:tubulin-specific chaperone A-like n=1 Tax=Bolinopsis microptera TaxID=2820187 RepID=UPI0030790B3D
MAAADNKRQLKIRTGVVKRLSKELVMYEQEVTDGEAKLVEMKEANKDEYDIRKYTEVVAESKAMVPDCRNRLRKAVQDLDILLEDNTSMSGEAEYKAAQEMRDTVSI